MSVRSITRSALAVASAAAAFTLLPVSAQAASGPACSKIYYLGSATNPSQVQLFCNGGSTVFRLNRPIPTHPNVSRGGVTIFEALHVGHEERPRFRSAGHPNCVAIRNLVTQAAAQTRILCG